MAESASPGRAPGAQTLARGLSALLLVVESPQPLSIGEVSAALGVHRTNVHRILHTLTEFGLLSRTSDGRYTGGSRLAALGEGIYGRLREIATPVLREVADDLGAAVALIAADAAEAIAVVVVEPSRSNYHIVYRQGSRHPLDRGSAGYALLSAQPPQPDEPEPVSTARARGYATSYGEVEPSAYGVAVPVAAEHLRLCLNLITYREDLATAAPARMLLAASQLADKLA